VEACFACGSEENQIHQFFKEIYSVKLTFITFLLGNTLKKRIHDSLASPIKECLVNKQPPLRESDIICLALLRGMKLWIYFDNYSIRIFDKHIQYDKTLKKKGLYKLVPAKKKQLRNV